MFIADSGSGFFCFPDPGVKKHRIPDLGSATLVMAWDCISKDPKGRIRIKIIAQPCLEGERGGRVNHLAKPNPVRQLLKVLLLLILLLLAAVAVFVLAAPLTLPALETLLLLGAEEDSLLLGQLGGLLVLQHLLQLVQRLLHHPKEGKILGLRIRIDLMRIRIRIRIQDFCLIADSNSGSRSRIRIPNQGLMT
jgi:hypothetical protein